MMQNLLELQCLLDSLVNFLKLSIFLNALLPLLFNEVDKGLEHEKKFFC